jgi:murein DD-endopeptidase MepM/ murein hydrolase activator NlpD
MRVAPLAAATLVLLASSDGATEALPRPATAAAAPVSRVHVVARGDTLSGLAARYRVTVAALVAANRLSGERAVLRVGRRLVIPAAVVRPAPAARAAPTVARRIPPAKPAGRPRRAPPARGPRNLELAVPDFVDDAPEFVWPVDGPVSSTYGRRRSGWHRGVDIKAERGSVVFAAAAGIVVAAGVEPRYGRVVKIEHADGFVTVYAHNEENLVEVGMHVAAGDPVGTIGRTGRATAHHLHFEIRRGAAVYNPLYLLPLPPRVGQVDLTEESEEEHD